MYLKVVKRIDLEASLQSDGHSDWCEVVPHCSFDDMASSWVKNTHKMTILWLSGTDFSCQKMKNEMFLLMHELLKTCSNIHCLSFETNAFKKIPWSSTDGLIMESTIAIIY